MAPDLRPAASPHRLLSRRSRQTASSPAHGPQRRSRSCAWSALPTAARSRWIWGAVRPASSAGNTDRRARAATPPSMRVRATDRKALALTTDVTPRYCEADPIEGRQAGGRRGMAQHHGRRRPAAGRDRQPELRQSRASRSDGPARRLHPGHRRGLPAPSTSRSSPANVSLYNETNGRGILPDAHHWRRRAGRGCRRSGPPSLSSGRARPCS